MKGLGFTTVDINKLQKGEEITVSFKLDNANRTTIKKELIVRDIQKNTVGCEFEKSCQYTLDADLGFYLMA